MPIYHDTTMAMNTPPRKQDWLKTKIPNLFILSQSGMYYGRSSPKEAKGSERSLHTKTYAVAREKLRDWLLSLGLARTTTGSTWGPR